MTKSNALQTRLQDLFEQVNKTIEHLLNNLTYIYQSHGINYKVDAFYQPLIRMLTPFQLLSYFHIYQIQNLFDKQSKNFWSFRDQVKYVSTSSTKTISDFLNSKKQPKLNQYASLDGQPEISIAEKIKKQGNCKYGNMKNYIRMHQEKKLQKQILKAQQMEQSWSNEQQQYSLQKEYPPVFGKKSSSSKPHMSQNQQLKICEWVKGIASKGTLISKTDMIHQARLLTNGKTGSTGWCRGFLQRHPHLLNYIKRAKVNRRQKIPYMKSEDGKSLSESIEESENDLKNTQIYNEEESHRESYQNNQISDGVQTRKNQFNKQCGNNNWLNRNISEFHELEEEDYGKQSILDQSDEKNEKIKRKKK